MNKLTPFLALALFALPAAAQEEEAPAAEAPEGWTCTASFYGADDGCDCGCGIPDPDCEDAAPETCSYEWCDNGEPDPEDTTQCVETPPPVEGWTCSPGFYGGGDGCDCGCGAPDTDCEDNSVDTCQFNYCEDGMTPAAGDPSQCEPGEWTPPSSGDDDTGDDGSDDDGYDDGGDDGYDDEPTAEDDAPQGPAPTGGEPVGEQETDPSDDEEPVSDGPEVQGSGCAATPGEPVATFFVGLLLLGWRRRRR